MSDKPTPAETRAAEKQTASRILGQLYVMRCEEQLDSIAGKLRGDARALERAGFTTKELRVLSKGVAKANRAVADKIDEVLTELGMTHALFSMSADCTCKETGAEKCEVHKPQDCMFDEHS